MNEHDEYSKYVVVYGPDGLDCQKVDRTLRRLFSLPEVKKVIEDAYALHKKPLEVVVDRNLPNGGYSDGHCSHRIYYNFDLDELITVGGEMFLDTEERFFCHELVHATQSGILDKTDMVNKTKKEASKIFIQQILPFVNEVLEAEKARRNGARPFDEELSRYFDDEILPLLRQKVAAIQNVYLESQEFMDYVNRYEIPAVRFENMMAEKYGFGLPRTEDYVGNDLETHLIAIKQRFLEADIRLLQPSAQITEYTSDSRIVHSQKGK